MTQTILGMDKNVYTKKIKNRKIICHAVLLAMVLLNILFTLLRSDSNHGLMLFLNIFVDSLCGWFVIYFSSFWIFPQKRLLKIFNSGKSKFRGEIVEISEEMETIQSIICNRVVVGATEQRVVFLPANGAIVLNKGEIWVFSVASGLIAEVNS
jgi:hypothetical protein